MMQTSSKDIAVKLNRALMLFICLYSALVRVKLYSFNYERFEHLLLINFLLVLCWFVFMFACFHGNM